MTMLPSVTWPSPPSATVPPRRTLTDGRAVELFHQGETP